MSNEKKAEKTLDSSDGIKPSRTWFVYGIENVLVQRLEEIPNEEVLVDSDSTLELIQCSFRDWKIKVSDLGDDQLFAVDAAMPFIIEDLKRLNYPLLQPEMFPLVEQFAEKVRQEIEARGYGVRGEIEKTLKG